MESAKEEAWVPVDSATAQKAWMEYGMPGEPHKVLAESSGDWEGEISTWMGEGQAPMVTKGTMSSKMIMDGRYQLSNFTGDFMGMPFQGMSMMGYDNHKKMFMSTWIDNMGTGMMKMEGPWDESSKSMTLTGTMVDPTREKECDMKEIYRILDKDNHVMEMYGPDPQTGKQFKSMEIRFTRKK